MVAGEIICDGFQEFQWQRDWWFTWILQYILQHLLVHIISPCCTVHSSFAKAIINRKTQLNLIGTKPKMGDLGRVVS